STFVDRTMVRFFEPAGPDDRSLGGALYAASSLAAGVGAGVLIHNVAFSSHDEYSSVTDQINASKDQRHSLEPTNAILGTGLPQAKRRQINAKANSLTKTIAQQEKQLPQNYDPNVDSTVSFLGGIAATCVVATCGSIAIRKRLPRARQRVSGASQPASS